MKTYLIPLIILIVISFASFSTAQDGSDDLNGTGEKACILSVTSSSHADVDCVGDGTVCSSVWDCFEIFKPTKPQVN